MNSPLLKSFIKFLMVGVLNTWIGLTVTSLALEGLHLNYWVSTGFREWVRRCDELFP
jgi:putative flippase GtrA